MTATDIPPVTTEALATALRSRYPGAEVTLKSVYKENDTAVLRSANFAFLLSSSSGGWWYVEMLTGLKGLRHVDLPVSTPLATLVEQPAELARAFVEPLGVLLGEPGPTG